MSTTADAPRAPIPTAATEVPGLRVGNAMADAYVTVGCEAYISGRPLINMANRVAGFTGLRAWMSMAIGFSPLAATKFPTGGHRFSPLVAIRCPHCGHRISPPGTGPGQVRGITPLPAVACASR